MLEIVILCFALVNLGVAVATLILVCAERRVYRQRVKERKMDEIVDKAITEQAKRDLMDEGFENIMAYSVNGHDGFGRTDE